MKPLYNIVTIDSHEYEQIVSSRYLRLETIALEVGYYLTDWRTEGDLFEAAVENRESDDLMMKILDGGDIECQ